MVAKEIDLSHALQMRSDWECKALSLSLSLCGAVSRFHVRDAEGHRQR